MHQDDTAREKSGTVPDAELKRIEEERIIYARLHAITGNFIVVYVVDPETDGYREFSATDSYVETFAQAKDGTDFFGTVREANRFIRKIWTVFSRFLPKTISSRRSGTTACLHWFTGS